MARYRVSFERIGRNHAVPPLEVDAGDVYELEDKIFHYATPHLRSRSVNTMVDLAKGTGFISCGMNSGGEFTIEALPSPEQQHGK